MSTKWTYHKKRSFASKAGLKKLFAYRHPTLDVRVGSVGQDFFFILVKISLVSRALPLFDIIMI